MPLSASQRVFLITETAKRLSKEDYSLIDLTLRQFNLPWTDDWEGTKESYTIRMIEEAPGDVLSELARHVGIDISSPADERVDPPFWQPSLFRLFISHLAAYRKYAAELQGELLKFGITAFVAHNDIKPTLEWQSQIETALATSDALLALLHPKFHNSDWTDQEIGFAVGRGLPTFAVQLGQVPYGFIGRFQAFSGDGKSPSDLASELFDAYSKNKQTQKKMAQAAVSHFEQSNSFVAAKTRMGLLEKLDYGDSSMAARIEAAVKSNGQISGSFGVSNRASKLAKRWSAN